MLRKISETPALHSNEVRLLSNLIWQLNVLKGFARSSLEKLKFSLWQFSNGHLITENFLESVARRIKYEKNRGS